MKTLYFECNMGAAGDMIMSALLELHPQPDSFMERLNGLGIPNVTFKKSTSVKCGISGTHVEVAVGGTVENEHMHEHGHHHEHEHHHEHGHSHEHHHEHEHHHTGMSEIEHIIGHLDIPERVKNDAIGIYKLIAEAESHAHSCEISEIHFHEVGTMDAVADVVGTCLLINELNVDRIIASPINVGSGQVRCAHGILPVPAPATAHILGGVPIYSNDIQGELCTPTGAAILKYFSQEFSTMPVMKISKIGYGMGSKDFEAANCVRVMLGETQDKSDTVSELCCNLDDMTGEAIGFAIDRLFDAGALDVFTTPIGMKKNRPGILLTCICRENQRDEMLGLIFKHTSTIGVREYITNRYTLDRTIETTHTQFGDVRVKRSTGWGVSKIKAEYDDMEKIARENNISISDIELNQ
ncbi:MAG: nickel pincer cofactor biosynthesis protein LarC [Clostridia bacterium]|nr:nickel pincer cofactor biosynthesis protein LarC [Clostridia bacterium]